MKTNLFMKSAAFILAVVLMLAALACGIALGAMSSEKISKVTPESLHAHILDTRVQPYACEEAERYAAMNLGNCPEELCNFLYGYGHAFQGRLDIYYEGELVASCGTQTDDAPLHSHDFHFTVSCPFLVDSPEDFPEYPDTSALKSDTAAVFATGYSYDIDGTIYHVVYREVSISVKAYYDYDALLAQSQGSGYHLLLSLYPYRYWLGAAAAVALLLAITLFLYLMWAAGRDKEGHIAPAGLSCFPLDLYLAVSCIPWLIGMNMHIRWSDAVAVIVTTLALTALLVQGLGFCYILAAQIKCKGGFWWRHSVIGWCLCRIGRFLRLCGRGVRAVFEMLPTVWQWLAIAGGMCFLLGVTFLLGTHGSYWRSNGFLLLFLLVVLGCLSMIVYGGWCFGTVLIGAKKMSEGELEYRIDEKHLFGAFRTCAGQLNSLSGAADKAAQAKMRSERMKTELITNVSHDIKTPLTSIINYIDLLQQPHLEAEGREYLEVLARQSQSLKKLIEDLMELSKASTGNMATELTALDAVEAARQALGEYAEKLESAQLVPVFRAPEQSVPIRADGKLLWRVLSNLLDNAVKYAQPGTRVYVEVTAGEQPTLSIRNISRQELTLSAEELLERFVQGDSSRSSEGSGLGLNIAKSLMQIQQGDLTLTVDGDLFKVSLAFPKG